MRPVVPAVTALLAAALLGACSSSGGGTSTSAPTTTASSPSVAQTPSSTPQSSSSAPASSGGLTEAQATAALLSAAEVGPGFTEVKSDPKDTPLPCAANQPPLDTRYPPRVKVQAGYNASGVDAAISEEIESYADAATVAKTITAGEQGLSCGSVTSQGTTYTISKPVDFTTQLKGLADKAEGWTITTSQAKVELAIVQMGQNLVVFTFAAATSVDTTKLPDLGTVIATGLQKVKAQG